MMNSGKPMYQPQNTQMGSVFSGLPNASDLRVSPLYRTNNESRVDQGNNQSKLIAMNNYLTNNALSGGNVHA